MKTLHPSVPSRFRSRFTAPLFAVALTLALLPLAPTGARADDYFFWQNPNEGNWNISGQWSVASPSPDSPQAPAAAAPGAISTTGNVFINTGTAVLSIGSQTINNLYLGYGGGSQLFWDGQQEYEATLGHDGDNGTLVINGDGNLTVTSLWAGVSTGGSGNVLLTDNAVLNTDGAWLATAENTHFSGTLNGNAQWNNTNFFNLGGGGNAELLVDDNARVVSSIDVLLGDAWHNSTQPSTVQMTMQGHSSLEVMAAVDANMGYNYALILTGHTEGSSSSLTLRENATAVIHAGVMVAAGVADGSITLADHASLTVDSFQLGSDAGTQGKATLTLSGNATLNVGNQFNVGFTMDGPAGEIAFILADGDTAHINVNTNGGEWSILSLNGAFLSLDLAGITQDDTFTLILLDSFYLNDGDVIQLPFFDRFGKVLVGGVDVSQTWTNNGDGSYTFDIGDYHATLNYAGGDGNDVTLDVQVAAVPEPGTWAMMVGGLGVLTLIMRRRRAGVGNRGVNPTLW